MLGEWESLKAKAGVATETAAAVGATSRATGPVPSSHCRWRGADGAAMAQRATSDVRQTTSSAQPHVSEADRLSAALASAACGRGEEALPGPRAPRESLREEKDAMEAMRPSAAAACCPAAVRGNAAAVVVLSSLAPRRSGWSRDRTAAAALMMTRAAATAAAAAEAAGLHQRRRREGRDGNDRRAAWGAGGAGERAEGRHRTAAAPDGGAAGVGASRCGARAGDGRGRPSCKASGSSLARKAAALASERDAAILHAQKVEAWWPRGRTPGPARGRPRTRRRERARRRRPRRRRRRRLSPALQRRLASLTESNGR